jgi:segregation and condensation protein A
MSFQVELEMYQGPLDLLLYLVRKNELEITDIPIAPIANQFLQYVEVLEKLDVDAAGEFLDMASTLVEIKSRMLLPHEEEVTEEVEDPRQDLVRRLLEFKQYRDAASMLDERGRQWHERYPRLTSDVPERLGSPLDQPIQGVELWDLVSALGRVLRDRSDRAAQIERIEYDETPIHTLMEQICTRLTTERRMEFSGLFPVDAHKSTLVGMFLAVLELIRHGHVTASQPEAFGEIWLQLGRQPFQVVDG